jgi:hypothetical protein
VARMAPPSTRLYATLAGRRYHALPGCTGRRTYPISRATAQARALTPCAHCAPPALLTLVPRKDTR